MSGATMPETGELLGPTRAGMLAELARLRDCAAGQGMDAVRDLLEAIAAAMMATAQR